VSIWPLLELDAGAEIGKFDTPWERMHWENLRSAQLPATAGPIGFGGDPGHRSRSVTRPSSHPPRPPVDGICDLQASMADCTCGELPSHG